MCQQVLEDLQVDDPLLEVAEALEEAALQDEYFASRRLFPNVDFYSGIVLRALGIPTNMFTVIFTMGRSVGWISQWNEMINAERVRIGRPSQLYTGPAQRAYVPIEQRK